MVASCGGVNRRGGSVVAINCMFDSNSANNAFYVVVHIIPQFTSCVFGGIVCDRGGVRNYSRPVGRALNIMLAHHERSCVNV